MPAFELTDTAPGRLRQLAGHLAPAPSAAAALAPLTRDFALRPPAYVIDLDICTRNANRMLSRAEALNVTLRPHMKTHKTLEGGVLQTGGTKTKIVVSTLAEARFFADGGFEDILYAVPITPDKLPEARALTERLQTFHILVDNIAQVEAILAYSVPAGGKPWSVFLMVDCGYHRDGVDPLDPASVALALQLHTSPDAVVAGVYTHGGHSYGASTVSEVVAIGGAERDAVGDFAELLRKAAVPCPEVPTCIPTCSLHHCTRVLNASLPAHAHSIFSRHGWPAPTPHTPALFYY
jgi:D-serine deaminase-like pyridoxal phosphate-dependent protein